ncbi:hypothetical protein F9B85_04215 [Heliorestis acidaminivorans]|uniref:Uncharacterized protein n=1 Tax=Heliorestis acidaminivorans TaxID=553427 RepID=A0A6I0F571_9FIRM|nr:hypothetical protein [Heliorestis acidaminivorans]KAB2953827.1 hypothetical protein F9B85_04215 [Heliorestis acidaminivorans]
MIVSTMTIVALRCQTCGAIDFHGISLFTFAKQRTQQINCTCGAKLMTVGTKDRKRFYLQAHCIMCESQHLFWYLREKLWSQQLSVLHCEENLVEIGFVGPRDKVKEAIMRQDKSLREMAENLGVVEYFENPEVMYGILEYLHTIAENGKLYCTCSSHQINVDIYPDRVELRCEVCSNNHVCYAESDHDLQMIKRVKEVQIEGPSLSHPRNNRGTRRRRSKKST